MSYVIKLWFDSAGPSEHEGRYVERYDPDYLHGLGRVWSCAKPSEAIHFATFPEATEFWRQVSFVRPLRDDGKPNRPLTAFTVSIEVL